MEAKLMRRFCDIAYERAGIRIGDGKESLVTARIGKRLRALGLESPREYLQYLLDDESGEELVQFLDVISTNFTSFMREEDHFELLRQVVRERIADGCRDLRIWCAASSTGEEPYSIAMTVHEAIDGAAVEYRILATDISTRALDAARRGVYEPDRLTKLTRLQRATHFERVRDAAEELYAVRPELKQHISFQRLNLARPPFPMKGPFDVVLCRNVMIYFDAPVRQGLVSEIERLLRPGQPLMIGHAETLTGLRTGLTALRPSVYRRPSAVPGATAAVTELTGSLS